MPERPVLLLVPLREENGMEMELFPIDPLNEQFGFTLRFMKKGEVVQSWTLSFEKAYFLMGQAMAHVENEE